MGAAKRASSDVLDRLARTGEAVFARDAGERIVFWSRKCEEMLGLSARTVLGKRCHEVTGGRDRFGNVYCHRGCPIAAQARDESDPVRKFPLRIDTKDGSKWFDVGTFAIRSWHPSLATVVHILHTKRAVPGRPIAALSAPEPPSPVAVEGDLPILSPRERQTLQVLAEGLTSEAIAERLFISPVTVRNHIAAVLQKLDVHSKFAAVAFAYRHHLV